MLALAFKSLFLLLLNVVYTEKVACYCTAIQIDEINDFPVSPTSFFQLKTRVGEKRQFFRRFSRLYTYEARLFVTIRI